MKILNFGSLNIDHVYHVEQIVKSGETIDSTGYHTFPGGKGLNQSVALGRANAKVYHAGLIGEDGKLMLDVLKSSNVDCHLVRVVQNPTGSAFIQVDSNAQNCIVLNGGANRSMTEGFIDEVLSEFEAGDLLLLQNEINLIDKIIDKAFDKGLIIALNPSPMNRNVLSCRLEKISLFILNEHEGRSITGKETDEEVLATMMERFPKAQVVLTLGGRGSMYRSRVQSLLQKAFSVPIVDTTAAGDTFTGYFLAEMVREHSTEQCLEMASKAAALAISKQGATTSIPLWNDVSAAQLL